MAAQWFYAIRGAIHGPVTSSELRQHAQRNELAGADLVWREGMADWATAGSLGLAANVEPPPLPSVAIRGSQAAAPPPPVNMPPFAPPQVTTQVAKQVSPERPAVTSTPETSALATGRLNDGFHAVSPGRKEHRSPVRRVFGLVVAASVILAIGVWIGRTVGNPARQQGPPQVARGRAADDTAERPDATKRSRPVAPGDSADSRLSGPTTAQPPEPALGSAGEDRPGELPLQAGLTAVEPASELPAGGPLTAEASPTGDGRSISPSATTPASDSLPDAPLPVSATVDTSSAESAGPTPLALDPSPPALPPLSVEPPLSTPPPILPASSPDVAAVASGPRVLYQVLEIDRRPSFVVAGTTINQELRYRIVSKLEIGLTASDGTRKVVQFVERTHLDHADELSRATYAKSLKALEGQQYTFKLNEKNEVIEFTGLKKSTSAIPVKLPSSMGFQMSTVIDEDGWKELAQLSFFQPDRAVAQGQPYVRQMSHDWTPLGAWSGTTTFVEKERRGNLQSITFEHTLNYQPPKAKDAAGAFGFRIASAECRIERADGTIEYDQQLRHVTQARETFQVFGEVNAELARRPVAIGLKEQQLMTIRLTSQRPSGN